MQIFDRLTDADAMRGLFQLRLPEFAAGNLGLTRCDILYARYKTFVRPQSRHKSHLALCYELAVSDGAGCPIGTQLLYAKAFRDGGSAQRFSAATAERLAAPRFGRAVLHLADLDMVIWAFPNDPELPHLACLVDPKAVLPFLPYDSLPPSVDGPDDVANVSAQVIHYYPEKRCTARYLLSAVHGASRQTLSLIGKTYRDRKGLEVHRHMQNLWEISQRAGDFAVAEPLGYNDAVKTVWQKDMPGVPVGHLLTAAKRRHWLTRIAKGLASLHRNVPASAANYGVTDPLGDLPNKVEKLGHAFADLRDPLRALHHAIEQWARQRYAPAQTFIHGDFHLRQLLAHEESMVFLDFDECALGDPLQDLASFIVDLHFYDFAPAELESLSAAFLRAYMDQCGWEVRRDDLAWYIRLQFFTKAYRAYRQHLPEREARVRELLALAQGWPI